MELKDNLSKSGNLEETIKDFFGNSNKKDTKSNPSGCLGCLGLIILIVTISIIADSFKSCSQSVSSRKDEKILAELLAGKTYSGESEWTRVMGALMKHSVQVHFSKNSKGELIGDVTLKTYSNMDKTYVEHLICDIVCEYRNESSMIISSSPYNIKDESGNKWGGIWELTVDYSEVKQHIIPKTINCIVGESWFSLYLQGSVNSHLIVPEKDLLSQKIRNSETVMENNRNGKNESINFIISTT